VMKAAEDLIDRWDKFSPQPREDDNSGVVEIPAVAAEGEDAPEAERSEPGA
jgi:hypothetical protein